MYVLKKEKDSVAGLIGDVRGRDKKKRLTPQYYNAHCPCRCAQLRVRAHGHDNSIPAIFIASTALSGFGRKNEPFRGILAAGGWWTTALCFKLNFVQIAEGQIELLAWALHDQTFTRIKGNGRTDVRNTTASVRTLFCRYRARGKEKHAVSNAVPYACSVRVGKKPPSIYERIPNGSLGGEWWLEFINISLYMHTCTIRSVVREDSLLGELKG